MVDKTIMDGSSSHTGMGQSLMRLPCWIVRLIMIELFVVDGNVVQLLGRPYTCNEHLAFISLCSVTVEQKLSQYV